MAYYTGRDVDVFLSTEHDTYGIKENSSSLELEVFTGGGDTTSIAYPGGALGQTKTKFTDVTGVDVSVGSQDEDISYMGLRNVGKIEVKKDTSITITMKKKDRKFLQLYQGSTATGHTNGTAGHSGRWGLIELTSGDEFIQDGTVDPKGCVDVDATTKTTYGFRLAIEFKAASAHDATDGALLVIPNCTISEVTHSTSNEAADEESVTFTSQVKPMVGDGKRVESEGAFAAYATARTLLTDV